MAPLTPTTPMVHIYSVMQWCTCSSLVSSFACRGGLRKSRADCFAVGLYCVTIAWQQNRKGSLYTMVAGVLLYETVERTHLGR